MRVGERSWQSAWHRRFYSSREGWIDGTTEFWNTCESAIPRGSRILELGPGPGGRTSQFLSTLGELHGADVDPAVRQNEALRSAALIENDRLPFPDASFDACVSDFVLEHVAEPRTHFAEVQRVLKPGGVYVFRTPNRWHYVALAARATPHWFHELISNRLRNLPSDAHEPYRTYFRANSRSALVRLARGAGLRSRSLRTIEKEPSYGMSSRLLFLLFAGYERLVNSSDLFAGLRINILAVLEKP